MNEPAIEASVKNENSRCFGEVLRTELKTVLPDLVLAPRDPPKSWEEQVQLEKAMIDGIDHHDTELAALCLSGGGIRSAIFALGALQGLARFGLLEKFHYLSTVSGGGYIGSWLSAWRSIDSDRSSLRSAERSANAWARSTADRRDPRGQQLFDADT